MLQQQAKPVGQVGRSSRKPAEPAEPAEPVGTGRLKAKRRAAPGGSALSDIARRLHDDPDGDLLIPEPDCWRDAADADGERFGRQALAAYCSLRILRLGCVLGGLGTGGRKIVWHVAPSSVVLAYGLGHLLAGNLTQVVTGAAEPLAAMAEWLRQAAPERSLLVADGGKGLSDEAWSSCDFVFLPDAAPQQVRPPRLDLAVSLSALQRMEREEARAWLRRVHDLGCLFLYSLSLAARGDAAEGAQSLAPLISEYYWPHPLPLNMESGLLRAVRDTLMPPLREAAAIVPAKSFAPEFIIGWRKIIP